MIVALLALLPPIVLGWMVVRCLLPAPPRGPAWARWTLEISLSVGTGLGLTSILYFLLLAVGLRGRVPIVAVEAVALMAAAWALRQRAGAAPLCHPNRRPNSPGSGCCALPLSSRSSCSRSVFQTW